MSYAKVAAEVGRGVGTVARVASAAGWSAEQSAAVRTRAARKCRTAFSAERRAESAATAQERADQALEQLGTLMGSGSELDARACADMAKTYQLLERTVLDISKHDVKADEGNAGGLLVQFVDQLRAPASEAA